MKRTYLLLATALFMMSTIIGCKSRKGNKSDATEVTLQVNYTEQYCGGAEPSEEMMEEMNSMRPYSNQEVYISKFIGMGQFADEKKVKLDKAGMISLSLDTGKYVVSFYQLIEEEVELEDGNQEVAPDPTGQPNPEFNKKQCEKQWIQMMATPLVIKKAKLQYMIPMEKQCNPCEPPRP